MRNTNIDDIEKKYFDLKTKYFKIRTEYDKKRRSKGYDLEELLLLAEEFGACRERFVSFRETYGHLITVER